MSESDNDFFPLMNFLNLFFREFLFNQWFPLSSQTTFSSFHAPWWVVLINIWPTYEKAELATCKSFPPADNDTNLLARMNAVEPGSFRLSSANWRKWVDRWGPFFFFLQPTIIELWSSVLHPSSALYLVDIRRSSRGYMTSHRSTDVDSM